MKTIPEEVRTSAAWLSQHLGAAPPPRLLVILGSGWGQVVDSLMEIEVAMPFGEIPGFPESTVEGHAGRLLLGKMAGVRAWVMQGRFHYYEGYEMREVTFPIRVLARLGVLGVLLTNAAGGIAPDFRPGQLMLIRDHINFMGVHPLRGPNLDFFGKRFPDMTEAWNGRLRACFTESATVLGIPLPEGVYLAVQGPSFETPAEVRAFADLGADAVGMSTVPECLVARHCGLQVAGLSCITNLAAHVGGETLTHEEVAEAAARAQSDVTRLFRDVLPRIEAVLEDSRNAL